MPRLAPILPLLAFCLGGCARSDLGERAASQVVKKTVENEAARAKGSLQKIGNASLKGSSLIGSDPTTGAPLWKLSAVTIETQGQLSDGLPASATLKDATVELYRLGQLESTFAAPLIKFSNGKNGLRLLMPNGVRASDAGAIAGGTKGAVPVEVRAPRGDVDIKNRLVALSGGATLVRGPITATGQILKSKTDLARATLSGNVVAKLPQGTMRARTATFGWKENKLSAQTVTFAREDLTLAGDKLEADTAAERGVLSGNVRAQTPDARASAPAANFDWKADVISAANATVSREGATLKAASLTTDSHLKVARAGSVVVTQDGATLRAASAQGFENLSSLSGSEVTVVRAGTTLTAPRATARNWSENGGVFVGSGGVKASNERGTVRAQSATWTGGEKGAIEASGNVEIRAQDAVLRGARGRSDTSFQNATLSGDVRAQMTDGSTLAAPQVEKRGPKLVASGGATARFQTPKAGVLTLRAQRIETTIGGQSASATGDVRLNSPEGARASAARATYNRANGKVNASGGVTYDDPKRKISNQGESLEADLKLESAVILGARGQSSGDLKLFKGELFG